jgi:hypothetical protein
MSDDHAIIIYARPPGGPLLRIETNDVAATVAALVAQGYVIIDIIDIG